VPSAEVEGDSGTQEPSRKCESIRPSSVANTCCFHRRKFSSSSLRRIGVWKWCKETEAEAVEEVEEVEAVEKVEEVGPETAEVMGTQKKKKKAKKLIALDTIIGTGQRS